MCRTPSSERGSPASRPLSFASTRSGRCSGSSLESVDTTAVRGRRIAIDPGHGGAYQGSTGVHGPKPVNLAVSLELGRLLLARGARS
jgi:N-acetylmuramoyl-L-alanine amidase